MSITSVEKDPGELTISWIAEFDAPIQDVWQLWADPRWLERWLGPPTYPATVKGFDLSPGGQVEYVLTGPDGVEFGGTWTITTVQPHTSLEYVDGEVDSGAGMPVVNWSMRLGKVDGITRMELRSRFRSPEDMNEMIEMGTEEGHAATIGQMDALLVELAHGSQHESPNEGRA